MTLLNLAPLTVKTERGVSVLLGNRHLYSRFAPIEGAIKIAQQSSITLQTLYLIPSPLLCHGLPELWNRIVHGDEFSTLLLVEPLEVLLPLSRQAFDSLRQDDPEIREGVATGRILGNVVSQSGKDLSLEEALAQGKERILAGNFRRCIAVTLTGGVGFYQKKLDGWMDFFTQEIALYWKNRSTINHLSNIWYRNIFFNLPQLPSSLNIKSLNPEKKRCVALGAGQSLEESIDFLQKNRAELFILAADTVLPALLKQEIIPDCCLVLEGQHHNFKNFVTTQKNLHEIILITDICVDPAVIRLFPKRIFLSTPFSTKGFLKRLYTSIPQLPRIPQLGSVGILTLYLGIFLSENSGQDSLYTGGLDFSSPRGKSHARGTYYHTLGLVWHNRLNPIDNNYSLPRGEIELAEGFYSSPVLKNYQTTALELTQLIKMDGSSRFLRLIEKSPQTKKENNNFFKEFLLESKGITSHELIPFLNQEIQILENILKEKEGIQEMVGDDGEADYLSDTFVINSKEKANNHLAGKLKLTALRLLQTAKIVQNKIQ